jgi:hypothetical protein
VRDGLLLEPDFQAASACPGDPVSYTLTLENCTGAGDTFDLTTAGNNWPTSVDPVSASLAFGEWTELTAYVQIPCGVLGADTTTISATGQMGMATDDAVIDTTSEEQMGAWEVMAPMPAGRVFEAVAGTDDYIFVIGGTSDAGGAVPVNTTFRYDIVGDSWMTMTAMPAALDSIDAGVVGDMIYVPGGFADANTYVYDIAGDSWDTIAASGTFTWAIQYQVAVSGTTVYRLGGLVDNGAGGFVSTDRVWALDTVAETWTELPPMLQDRTSFGAGSIGGDLYAAGGVHFPGFVPEMTTEMFDGTSWSYVAAVPDGGGAYTRWSYNGDATADGRLFMIAGRRDAGWAVIDHLGAYDPATDSWDASPNLPLLNQGRVYLEGAAGRGYLFALGGRDPAGSVIYDTNERTKIAGCPKPEITVVAPPLDADLCPSDMTTFEVNLCNSGTGLCPLEWEVLELPPPPPPPQTLSAPPKLDVTPIPGLAAQGPTRAPIAPANPEDVLWDQVISGTTGIVSDFFLTTGFGTFAADDFIVPPGVGWRIETIFVDGFVNAVPLATAQDLNWYIWPDAGGVPAGSPGDGTEVFSLTLLSGDPAVTIVGNSPTLDLVMATGSALELPEGTYWLSFYPSMFVTSGDDRFNWFAAGTANGNYSMLMDEGNWGGFPWTPIAGLVGQPWWHDQAFRLEGRVLFDIPWLSEDPTSSDLLAGECITVDVTLDSDALAPGDYYAGLDFLSNDAMMPFVTLPVHMGILQPLVGVDFDWSPITPTVDDPAYFTGTVALGEPPIAYTWDFDDGFGDVGPFVNHAFTAMGAYTVTLRAENACGYVDVQHMLYVERALWTVFLPLVPRTFP